MSFYARYGRGEVLEPRFAPTVAPRVSAELEAKLAARPLIAPRSIMEDVLAGAIPIPATALPRDAAAIDEAAYFKYLNEMQALTDARIAREAENVLIDGRNRKMPQEGVEAEPSLFDKVKPWLWVPLALAAAVTVAVVISKRKSMAGYRRRRRSRK